MIKWFVQTLLGWPWCAHHWTIIDHCDTVERQGGVDVTIGQTYYLQCSKCGDVKRRRL